MSQINCKLSNFTLSKLTFTVDTQNKNSEIQYILNLAESVEFKANDEEHVLKIIKLDEQKYCYIFKAKLSQKLAFVEDYFSKEIFLQDLSNFRRINKTEKNESFNENKNLNSKDDHFENNLNQTNQVTDINSEKEQKITNETDSNTFSIHKNHINKSKNSDILLVCHASNTNNLNQNHLINHQNKINEGNLNEMNNCLVSKGGLEEKESKEDKTKKNLSQLDPKSRGETPLKTSASLNNFIDYVKSNIINLNAVNQSQEEIILNKQKLLNEIMNETICEEIFIEESTPKGESPRTYWNQNLKMNKLDAEFKADKIENNLINAQMLGNNSPLNSIKLPVKNENYLSHSSEKLPEQYALGSEIIKDLNTQCTTLCLITANKSNENQLNSMEAPIFKEAADPDIIEQQKKIDELIKQAMSDNEKLKNEYLCQSNNIPAVKIKKEDFVPNKNLISFPVKAEGRNTSEKVDFIAQANSELKESTDKKALEQEKTITNDLIEFVYNEKGEKIKYVNLVKASPVENCLTINKNQIETGEFKTNITVETGKIIDLTEKKIIDKYTDNSYLNLNHNETNDIDLKVKSSPTIVDLISSQGKIDQKNIVNKNLDNQIAENLYQKKYEPIDVEAFLKTLFSVENK